MPNVCTLSDGVETVDFYDYVSTGGLGDGGHEWGEVGSTPRTLKLQARFFTTESIQQTLPGLEVSVSKIRRLLAKAGRTTSQGSQRKVILTVQPFEMGVPTRFYVLSGFVAPINPFQAQFLVNHIYDDVEVTLQIEPWGFGAEQAFGTAASRTGKTSIDFRFTATGATSTALDGTFQGVNVAALVQGSLAQTNKFTLTPTVQALALGVAFYFGSSSGQFDRLVLGIESVKSGSWSGVWEYWNGSAWAGVATTSSFRTDLESSEFNRTAGLGAIIFTGSMTGWVAKNIGGNTANWVRYRINSFASGIAPVFTNGVSTITHLESVGAGVIPGDYEASGLVFHSHSNGNRMAGVKSAIITGELSDYPPPTIVDLSGADAFITTGDNTASIVTDAGAVNGERVEVNLLSAVSERAQTLDGSTEYITFTPTAGDKLATTPSGNFFVEILFKADVVPATPVCLASQWGASSATSSWWLGLDQGKLKFMIRTTGNVRKIAVGTTQVKAGEWVLATGMMNYGNLKISVLRDSLEEKQASITNVVRSGIVTPVRVGKSSGFVVADSISGQDTEGFFDGIVSNFRIVRSLPATEYPNGYNWPEIGAAIQNDSANTRWLLRMEDNAASLAITDSATTFAAALNAARSANNTSTRTTVGFFQTGSGLSVRVLGINMPRTWAEEYRGRVRIFLRASPGSALTTLDDVLVHLQLNVGDLELPMSPPVRFPGLGATPNTGYYFLDMGTYTLPPVSVRHTGPFSTVVTNTKDLLQANIFVRHNFLNSFVLYFDALYLFPTSTWYSDYKTFKDLYTDTYAITNLQGLLTDSLGPETIITQVGSTTYLGRPARNPYADIGGTGPVVLKAKKPLWVFSVGFQGENNYLFHVLNYSTRCSLRAVGRYDVLASA